MFIFTNPLQLKTQTHDVENVQITSWDMAALVSAGHHIHSPRMTRSPDLGTPYSSSQNDQES